MKYLDVEFDLPDQLLHPMQAFIRDSDAVSYEEMLAWRVQADEGIEYALYYVEAEMEPYREAVQDVETVQEYQIAQIDAKSAHVWVSESTRPETQAWRQAFADRQLIVVPPIAYDKTAAMRMTIVGDGESIQTLLDELPADVDVTISEIGTYDRRGGTVAASLTDRQFAAIQTAHQLGYYDVPRTGTLTDVAETLGCATSTASSLLRRAERNVFSELLDRYSGKRFARNDCGDLNNTDLSSRNP